MTSCVDSASPSASPPPLLRVLPIIKFLIFLQEGKEVNVKNLERHLQGQEFELQSVDDWRPV